MKSCHMLSHATLKVNHKSLNHNGSNSLKNGYLKAKFGILTDRGQSAHQFVIIVVHLGGTLA